MKEEYSWKEEIGLPLIAIIVTFLGNPFIMIPLGVIILLIIFT